MGKRNSRRARKQQQPKQQQRSTPSSPKPMSAETIESGDVDRRTSPEVAVHPGGRPTIDINLNELERLSSLQCTYPELAAFFRVSLSLIEKRMKDDETFRDAVERGRNVGLISLRRQQLAILDKGNATMAIWLGKNLLGQRDNLELTGDNRKSLNLSELDQAIADAKNAEAEADGLTDQEED